MAIKFERKNKKTAHQQKKQNNKKKTHQDNMAQAKSRLHKQKRRVVDLKHKISCEDGQKMN